MGGEGRKEGGRGNEKGWVGKGWGEGRGNRVRVKRGETTTRITAATSESCEGLDKILISYSEQPLTKVK